VLALGLLVLLVVASGLRPDASGIGTHKQLGLDPCPWMTLFDTPCPTCGMTTSFSHAANGQYAGAFHAQPLGATMAITSAAAFWLCLHVAIFGSRIGAPAGRLLVGWGPKLLVVALLGAWAYKVVVHTQ
jgi:hypothetical protein